MVNNNLDDVLREDYLNELTKILHHQLKNEEYVKHILTEAQALCQKTKDYYQIDWTYFPLIVKVSHLDPEWLITLDLTHITTSEYSKVYTLLNECVY